MYETTYTTDKNNDVEWFEGIETQCKTFEMVSIDKWFRVGLALGLVCPQTHLKNSGGFLLNQKHGVLPEFPSETQTLNSKPFIIKFSKIFNHLEQNIKS